MIDKLAIARNHDDGCFILATQAPDDEYIEFEYKAITSFIISVITTLIDEVLNNASSDAEFYAAEKMILRKVTETEEKRFQQREIKEDNDADA